MSESGSLESFSISAVHDGVVDVRETYRKYLEGDSVRDPAMYSLRSGDILLVRGNGNLHLVGKAGIVTEDMPGRVYPDLLMRVRLRNCDSGARLYGRLLEQ